MRGKENVPTKLALKVGLNRHEAFNWAVKGLPGRGDGVSWEALLSQNHWSKAHTLESGPTQLKGI